MLKLEHFYHLPQLDPLLEQLVADGPGLIVVAGLNPRSLPSSASSAVGGSFLPSGRSAIFRILLREILEAHPSIGAIVVAEDATVVRIPRRLRRRVRVSLVEPPYIHYADRIASAIRSWPGLLVIDRLCAETAPLALEAAQSGLRVLSQFDTVFRGADVIRHLLDLGVPEERLDGLAWIVAVQRLATLCPRCRQAVSLGSDQLDRLRRNYPGYDLSAGEPLFQSPGCADCRSTGRKGEVTCFDVYRAGDDATSLLERPSLLSLEEYVLRLAMLGYLSANDVLRLDADQLRRTYKLLTDGEQALSDANATLRSQLLQLEAAHSVLQQRTEALVSLHDIGQRLITSTDLDDLASRVCRYARDLCAADRAILYFLRSDEEAQVLATSGWDPALIHQRLEAAPVLEAFAAGADPRPYNPSPPGVVSPSPDIKAGLRVPLIAHGEPVGLMIVHTTQKRGFAPGEVAMFRTFANQAALAIQRAGLIEQLRDKIVQLEAAQAELVQKERIERELELARQVQQSTLPRTFPLSADYTFAAHNEPARWVGGDFYDVILLDADRFGLVIGDVSDKGMPAALYMALTRSLLLAEARAWSAPAQLRSPLAVLANVNRLLLELGEPNMFVSVFYGILEGGSRRLTYARAGHDRPLLLRCGVVQSLGGTGACLGILEQSDLRLSEEQVVLASGDRLVLYTDGLIDVLSSDGRLFGLNRFRSLLQSHANMHPEALCAATLADLATYQGAAEQYDDMTILVVGVK